jgi:hypothetical protein
MGADESAGGVGTDRRLPLRVHYTTKALAGDKRLVIELLKAGHPELRSAT